MTGVTWLGNKAQASHIQGGHLYHATMMVLEDWGRQDRQWEREWVRHWDRWWDSEIDNETDGETDSEIDTETDIGINPWPLPHAESSSPYPGCGDRTPLPPPLLCPGPLGTRNTHSWVLFNTNWPPCWPSHNVSTSKGADMEFATCFSWRSHTRELWTGGPVKRCLHRLMVQSMK